MGLLVVLAMTSITVYGVTLAGWSSNSKYSLLGGLRSSAQMISYELAMGAAALSVVLYAGSLSSLFDIVESQNHLGSFFGWNLFRNPVGFVVFASAPSPRPTARRSTSPRPSRSSSAATTRSTRG